MPKAKFLKVKTLKEAKAKEPNYKVFVKISGGYMAYYDNCDFMSAFSSFSPQCEMIL